MRVFLAGASGLVGVRLVPLLIDAGHTVVAMTRSPDKASDLRARGADVVVVDALDRGAVERAVAVAAPEVVVNQLTAIPRRLDWRRMVEQFEPTNRLRIEGTDHLVAAARKAGARRMVAQSFAPFLYERTGGPVKTEEDPVDPHHPGQLGPVGAALKHLESATLGAGLEAVVLRYGAFYGPGSAIGPGGDLVEAVRQRRVPVVGDGAGIWSFAHLDDVASATLKAIEGGPPGVYNITDDEPAPVSEWLPHLAQVLGARPPRWVPAFLAHLAVGEAGIAYMTSIRGASNAKAKALLGWTPRYPTWREGFWSLRTG